MAIENFLRDVVGPYADQVNRQSLAEQTKAELSGVINALDENDLETAFAQMGGVFNKLGHEVDAPRKDMVAEILPQILQAFGLDEDIPLEEAKKFFQVQPPVEAEQQEVKQTKKVKEKAERKTRAKDLTDMQDKTLSVALALLPVNEGTVTSREVLENLFGQELNEGKTAAIVMRDRVRGNFKGAENKATRIFSKLKLKNIAFPLSDEDLSRIGKNYPNLEATVSLVNSVKEYQGLTLEQILSGLEKLNLDYSVTFMPPSISSRPRPVLEKPTYTFTLLDTEKQFYLALVLKTSHQSKLDATEADFVNDVFEQYQYQFYGDRKNKIEAAGQWLQNFLKLTFEEQEELITQASGDEAQLMQIALKAKNNH